MNNWKAIGYTCLGVGSVILIYALFSFFTVFTPLRQIPQLAQTATSTALATATPPLILGSIMYVVGGVGLYMGRDNVTKSIISNSTNVTKSDFLYRLNRLEEIVDNNINVLARRLDQIEEKQKMFSQNTIIKAKRE